MVLRRTQQTRVAGGALLGTLLVATSAATAAHNPPQALTFTGTVALPGVVLPAGTYRFELAPDESQGDVVRVLSLDRSKVHLAVRARRVVRPVGLANDVYVTFGEPRPGAAPPIAAWYPIGSNTGFEFIYRGQATLGAPIERLEPQEEIEIWHSQLIGSPAGGPPRGTWSTTTGHTRRGEP